MKKLYLAGLLIFCSTFISSCKGQTKSNQQQLVGGAFENSEFTYYGIPRNISATDTSPG